MSSMSNDDLKATTRFVGQTRIAQVMSRRLREKRFSGHERSTRTRQSMLNAFATRMLEVETSGGSPSLGSRGTPERRQNIGAFLLCY
jgi:hypothetical protein